MKEYYNPSDFFTKEDSVEDIRKKLATMPKKGDPDFEPQKDDSIILCGMMYTEHGFEMGSVFGWSKYGTKDNGEAEAIYDSLHSDY